MAVIFPCSHCDQKISASDDAAGKRVRCPKCQNVSRVPETSRKEPIVPELMPVDAVVKGPPPKRRDKEEEPPGRRRERHGPRADENRSSRRRRQPAQGRSSGLWIFGAIVGVGLVAAGVVGAIVLMSGPKQVAQGPPVAIQPAPELPVARLPQPPPDNVAKEPGLPPLPPVQPPVQPNQEFKVAPVARKTLNLDDDPLPDGCLARMGTIRMVHGEQVQALVYSPDGKWLASAGKSKLIRLWDPETGKELKTLAGHNNVVRRLAFVPAPAGKPSTHLVSGGLDASVRVWELATGKEVLKIAHPGPLGAMALSPDAKFVATGNAYQGGQVRVWSLAEGLEVKSWFAHSGGVVALAYSPDGSRLISAGSPESRGGVAKPEPALVAWNPETGTKVQDVGTLAFVRSMAFSPDGRWLAASGSGPGGRGIHVWDGTTFQPGKRLDGEHGIQVDSHALAFSPDARYLAGHDFSKLIFWDVANGQVARTVPVHTFGSSTREALAFSSDGKMFASGGENGDIAVWDMIRHEPHFPLPDFHSQHITGVVVSPDGQFVASSSYDGTARLWERKTGKYLRTLRSEGPSHPLVWNLAYAPNGAMLALGHQWQGISIWDPTTGQLLKNIPYDKTARIISVAFSSDSKSLAADNIDENVIRIWDPKTGALVDTVPRNGRGGIVEFSPTKNELVSSAGGSAQVWDLAAKKVRLLLPKSGQTVKYSPDGKLLATVGSDVKVWDGESGKELGRFVRKFTVRDTRALVFSPDNRLLAFGDIDRIRLCEVTTLAEVASLTGHRGTITCLAFTPDGDALVSGSDDLSLLVWDIRNAVMKK